MSLVLAVVIWFVIICVKASDSAASDRVNRDVEAVRKERERQLGLVDNYTDIYIEEGDVDHNNVLFQKLKSEVENELNIKIKGEVYSWLYMLSYKKMTRNFVRYGICTKENSRSIVRTREMMARQLKFMKWYEDKLHEYGVDVTIMYCEGRNITPFDDIKKYKIRDLDVVTIPGWYYVEEVHPYLASGYGGSLRFLGFDEDFVGATY